VSTTEDDRARVLVSFDIDGTMEFGDPPGPVTADVARELFDRGYIVGVASDWPRSSQQPLWSSHGMEPFFVGGKHHLHEVRAEFEADHYIHVGDTDVDERYAKLAGFAFVHVDDLVVPVGADAILAAEPPAPE
jgi:phosphoglycolate phosphatase-like HAD superfamily hydrolase